MYIWVQIYDLPIGFNSEHILKSIGNHIGAFLEIDPKNFQGIRRNYLWIKVTIICFFCGIIGHSDKFCEALFDSPQSGDERKYDSSLRASIRRQNNPTGNQWLRDANGGYGGITKDITEWFELKTNSRDLCLIQRESSNHGFTRDNCALNQEERDEEVLNVKDLEVRGLE